jgi:putative chitinase
MRFFGIQNIDEIDFGKLVGELPGRSAWNPFSTQGQYVLAILQSYSMLQEHEINTALRLAHFLGQGIVETNYLRAKSENLNYSFDVLKRLFGHKFSGDDEIREYARNPEKIANRIYANRMDNGPEESGDGWRYRGRGFFQLTGKQNYRYYGELAGVDLLSDPDVLERDLKRSLQVAAAYFQKTGLAEFADRNDIAAVSRGINRGDPRSRAPAFHEAERIQWTAKALAVVRDPAALLKSVEPEDGSLRNGSTGEAVRALQEKLARLGYPVGAADGIFGPATRRAVLAFQDEHELSATGVADQATMSALDAALDDGTSAPSEPPVEQPAPQPEPAAPPPVVSEEPAPEAEPPPVVTETPAAAPETPPVVTEAPAEQPAAAPPAAPEAPAEQPAAAPLEASPPVAPEAPADAPAPVAESAPPVASEAPAANPSPEDGQQQPAAEAAPAPVSSEAPPQGAEGAAPIEPEASPGSPSQEERPPSA